MWNWRRSQLLDLYFSMWESPDTSLVVRALFRASLEPEEHHGKLQSLLGERLASGLSLIAEQRGLDAHHAQDVRSEDVEMRFQKLAAHLLGVGVSRYILRVSPIADVPRAELIGRLAPMIERYFLRHIDPDAPRAVDEVDRDRLAPFDPHS